MSHSSESETARQYDVNTEGVRRDCSSTRSSLVAKVPPGLPGGTGGLSCWLESGDKRSGVGSVPEAAACALSE